MRGVSCHKMSNFPDSLFNFCASNEDNPLTTINCKKYAMPIFRDEITTEHAIFLTTSMENNEIWFELSELVGNNNEKLHAKSIGRYSLSGILLANQSFLYSLDKHLKINQNWKSNTLIATTKASLIFVPGKTEIFTGLMNFG